MMEMRSITSSRRVPTYLEICRLVGDECSGNLRSRVIFGRLKMPRAVSGCDCGEEIELRRSKKMAQQVDGAAKRGGFKNIHCSGLCQVETLQANHLAYSNAPNFTFTTGIADSLLHYLTS